MDSTARAKYLKFALIVFGIVFLVFAFGGLSMVWPAGWVWGTGHSHYALMIQGVYGTLGVFLILASRDPARHRSLIWFTVCSSVVHAAIMAWQSGMDSAERGHLIGDVPALIAVAVVLGLLTPRGKTA